MNLVRKAATLVLWAAVLYCVSPAIAQPERKGVMFDCHALANAIGRMAVYRDVEANQTKTIALARKTSPSLGPAQLAALEREIRRMWHERLPPLEAAFQVFKRCEAQLGDMGAEG